MTPWGAFPIVSSTKYYNPGFLFPVLIPASLNPLRGAEMASFHML
jgi:hypothetical protein